VTARPKLTQARVKELLTYSPETGEFHWLPRDDNPAASARIVGKLAGHRAGKYWRIRFDGRNHMAHRLAFLYAHGWHPKGDVDHRDGNGLNNWIDTLVRCVCADYWIAAKAMTSTRLSRSESPPLWTIVRAGPAEEASPLEAQSRTAGDRARQRSRRFHRRQRPSKLLTDWGTAIGGVLALIAGVGAYAGASRAATRQIQAMRRKDRLQARGIVVAVHPELLSIQVQRDRAE